MSERNSLGIAIGDRFKASAEGIGGIIGLIAVLLILGGFYVFIHR